MVVSGGSDEAQWGKEATRCELYAITPKPLFEPIFSHRDGELLLHAVYDTVEAISTTAISIARVFIFFINSLHRSGLSVLAICIVERRCVVDEYRIHWGEVG